MVYLKEDSFGVISPQQIRRFTWTSDSGVVVSVISYGATITSVKVPGADGQVKDVVLGFDDIAGYRRADNPYFGATVGRCANRIGGGTFQIDGVTYTVAKNAGNNHLHGGIVGFDKVNWNADIRGNQVTFSYLSKDKEEGYPGDLLTTVSYELNEENELLVEFQSVTTKPTVVNLTNHSYFNLAGHETGFQGIADHMININAEKITEVDDESIPTGRLAKVGGTVFDLRTSKKFADAFNKDFTGYDHNFCVSTYDEKEMTFVARAVHPPSGRTLEVYSDQPGVQFYTSNFLPKPEDASLPGKDGVGYRRHGAFCLETQNYPDAVNEPNFPSPILRPGEIYTHRVKYIFGMDRDSPDAKMA